MHVATNAYKRFIYTNSSDPRQRVPLNVIFYHSDSTWIEIVSFILCQKLMYFLPITVVLSIIVSFPTERKQRAPIIKATGNQSEQGLFSG